METKEEFIKRLESKYTEIKESEWCKAGTKDQQEGRKGALDRAINELNKIADEGSHKE